MKSVYKLVVLIFVLLVVNGCSHVFVLPEIFSPQKREISKGTTIITDEYQKFDTCLVVMLIVPLNDSEKSISSSFICDCNKICPDIDSCEEAQYQFDVCGCKRRDGDKDGVPCENICQF